MPAACRTYKVAGSRLRLGAGELGELTSRHLSEQSPPAQKLHRKSTHRLPHLSVDLPQQPQELLGFLNSMIDAQVRAVMGVHPCQVRNPRPGMVKALSTESNTVIAEPAGVERLEAALSAWTAPLQYQMTGQSLFRTSFPPASGETD